MNLYRIAILMGGAVLALSYPHSVSAERPSHVTTAVPRVQFRRPVAMATFEGRLLVANRKSGTLTTIDTDHRRVLHETKIGDTLSGLQRLSGDSFVLADEQAGSLLLGRLDNDQIAITQRLNVASSPVTICVSAGHGTISVASLWPRRLTLIKAHQYPDVRLEIVGTIDVPFAPRLQCFLPDESTLVVADAFGGKLAVVDTSSGQLTSVRSIDGHNIRGLTVSDDGQNLLIAHQTLTSLMPTTRERVFWGQVVSNLLRSVQISHVLEESQPKLADTTPVRIVHWSLQPLGESNYAAGDPGQIAITPNRGRAICLSGVNQIGVSPSATGLFQRIDVGRCPTALALDTRRPHLYVANTFDDSITVVDTALGEVIDTISLGRTPIPSLVSRGEMLFYDARLSLDGWYSCHSCHTDGHTNGQLNDNFGDGTEETPKRVLSLLGAETTPPWTWTGTQLWLNTQVHKSIETTMRGMEDDGNYGQQTGALTEYVRTLSPAPGLRLARGEAADSDAIERGRELFRRLDCTNCHVPPVYTSYEVFDVGLEDEAGHREFNPPSLRGVSQLSAWFHDNRASSLPEVFTKFGHPNGETRDLSARDVNDLVTFLESL